MELSSPKAKSFLNLKKKIFSHMTERFGLKCKKQQQKKSFLKKFLIFFQKNLSPHFRMTADQAVK